MKECGKGEESVGESGKEWYFCLNVGKSGKGEGVGGCGKEWVKFIKPRKKQGPSYYSLCYFEPKCISLDLKPLLLTQFRMYQMYLSSQSGVLVVILNQAIHQRTLNPVSYTHLTLPTKRIV